MNKRKYLLIFIFITNLSFSQNSSRGSINYKAILNTNDYKNKDTLNKVNLKFYNLLKNQKDGDYILYFKNNKSLFKKDSKMKNDAKSNFDLVSIFAGNGKYYYNFYKNEILIQKEVFGEFFLINDNLKYKWKFTQETKKIGSYLCYKATTIKNNVNRKGIKFETPIIAWYTLKIPIKFGVKDYLGLPGATIVLEEGKIKYIATKITFDESNIEEINKPTKGKLITQEKLNFFLKENMFKRYKN